jgi:hypothetical protein
VCVSASSLTNIKKPPFSKHNSLARNYPPSEDVLARNGNNDRDVSRYPSTDIQLLIFDDGPRAAPTIGHSRIEPCVAQFAELGFVESIKTELT